MTKEPLFNQLKRLKQYILTLILTTITAVFWFGIFTWLSDGAWENGALPTHGINHMAIGFFGCWACYLSIYWITKKYSVKE